MKDIPVFFFKFRYIYYIHGVNEMQTRSKQIRLTPATKERLEKYREYKFGSYAPLGKAVETLLDEVVEDD